MSYSNIRLFFIYFNSINNITDYLGDKISIFDDFAEDNKTGQFLS